MSLANSVKQALPPSVRSPVVTLWRSTAGRRYPRKSWSQGGEDLVLLELLGSRGPGTYVDVGAFHPRWGSNTFALYQHGWSGINIDARPGSMGAFRRNRRRDINLEIGVGPAASVLDFYVFADDELSTFDADLAKLRQKSHSLLTVEQVEVAPLVSLLEKYRPSGVDLLLVDAEGYDVAILKSNDWTRFRPQIVVAESLSVGDRLEDSEVARFMSTIDYRLVAATGMNLFFSPTI